MNVLLVLLMLGVANAAAAQEFSYRGFAEIQGIAYPQTTPSDDDRLGVDARVRLDPGYRPARWVSFSSSVEARTDSLHQVEWEWRLDWRDRGILRPAFSVRQFDSTLRKGKFALDLGKQFIRWGKTDILNPTDRFAPRDFLDVTRSEFLAVTGARLQVESGPHSLDVVWVPLFTPSRLPLLDRRWSSIPEGAGPPEFSEDPSQFPERAQAGIRWNVIGPGFDFSVSYFDGLNHFPEASVDRTDDRPPFTLQRRYQPLKMIGGDGSVSTRWFTIKSEAAFLKTTSATSDDVVLYVVQLERQSGELSLVGGYAGEILVERRAELPFAPDRGLTHAFLGRANYTIDANRTLAFEGAVRQTGDGVWLKGEYSQARGGHWRATLTGVYIAGETSDFFGQYHRNSHMLVTLRYSF